MGRKPIDITGQQFGALTALKMIGRNEHGAAQWQCLCECGNLHTTLGASLRKGEVTRCAKCRRYSKRPESHYTIDLTVTSHAGHGGVVVVAQDRETGRPIVCGGWSSRPFNWGMPWTHASVKQAIAQLCRVKGWPERSPGQQAAVWADRVGLNLGGTTTRDIQQLEIAWRAAWAAGAMNWAELDRLNMWERTRARALDIEPVQHTISDMRRPPRPPSKA